MLICKAQFKIMCAKWNRAHHSTHTKTMRVCIRLQAASACLRHCQEMTRQNIDPWICYWLHDNRQEDVNFCIFLFQHPPNKPKFTFSNLCRYDNSVNLMVLWITTCYLTCIICVFCASVIRLWLKLQMDWNETKNILLKQKSGSDGLH